MLLSMGQLQGILLSLARPELTIYANEKKHIGYEIRMRIFFRAESMLFLEILRDSFQAFHVECKIKESESKIRPKPVLWISGINNLKTVGELLPANLPGAKNQWDIFKDAIDIVFNGEHTTQDGLDRLLKLKGEI